MSAQLSNPATRENSTALAWSLAGACAALGAWVLFDALPGLNWTLFVFASIGALLYLVRPDPAESRGLLISAAAAALLGLGAAITANEGFHFFIFLGLLLSMAAAMLLSRDGSLPRMTPALLASAPLVAAGSALVESARRAVDASLLIRSPRTRALLRGAAITLPVLLVFALLLAGADPVFALWRDRVIEFIENWDFLPRTVFFLVLLVLVLGAFGYAIRPLPQDGRNLVGAKPLPRWLGETERLMLLAGVALLFWVFLAVQLSYLFGNVAGEAGSGITFSEYARRGFGELTIVATFTLLLVFISERFGVSGTREGTIRILTFAVVAAVLLLLASAFRRVSLYESAYGFTSARLYAKTYMLWVAATLALLVLELRRGLNGDRLFRSAWLLAAGTFLVLTFWNHEAHIANRNIDRFRSMSAPGGTVSDADALDVTYITTSLSLNAVPLVIARLGELPPARRIEVSNALHKRHDRWLRKPERWYEWNYRRSRARSALATLPPAPPQHIRPTAPPSPASPSRSSPR